MSVRAYIVRNEKTIYEDGKVYRLKIEDTTELFNIWHNTEIFDLIRYGGYDCTNDDSCGEIGITCDEWEEIKEEGKLNLFKEKEELEIIKDIEEYFESGEEVLVLNCY